jgi:predicted ATPase
LIDAVGQRGYACTLEAGLAIIQDQQAIGDRAHPEMAPAFFAERRLSGELRSYHIGK